MKQHSYLSLWISIHLNVFHEMWHTYSHFMFRMLVYFAPRSRSISTGIWSGSSGDEEPSDIDVWSLLRQCLSLLITMGWDFSAVFALVKDWYFFLINLRSLFCSLAIRKRLHMHSFLLHGFFLGLHWWLLNPMAVKSKMAFHIKV